ncbi:DMT family transporter [Calditrichota bacterium GD2]
MNGHLKQKLAPYFVILAASLWGVDGIVLRPYLYRLPVVLVVMIETSMAAILMTPFFIRYFARLRLLNYKEWLSLLAVALFGGAIGTLAITRAIFYVNYVNLSVVVLIQKLQPVFAIGLAALFLKERLSKRFLKWAALALIGAYFMTFGWRLPNFFTGDKTLEAAGFAMLATMSFAASTVFSKRLLRRIDFHFATYLRFLVTALIMVIVGVLTNTYQAIAQITPQQILVFTLIIFSTGAPAIFLYYYGLRKIPASIATICELSFPATAILLEYFVRHRLLDTVQWLGTFVLIFAIVRISMRINEWLE